jgi:putative glutamine amidotransferase
MPVRPVIGVTTAVERARWAMWHAEAHLTPRGYVDSVQRAGGLALLLPTDPAVDDDPDQLLRLLDGLVLTGGGDVDPATYGADRHPMTVSISPQRDRFELALARRAIERELPLLGICRGMQILNVARGGTLLQHLPESQGHDDHRRVSGSFEGSDHPVALQAGSLAARAAGEELHRTLSHHHQGVDRIGDGLIVTGRAVMDQLPEALELPGHDFVLGVQWHPEADETSRLVGALVAASDGR